MNNENLVDDPRLRDVHDKRKAWQAPVVEELPVDDTGGSSAGVGGDYYDYS